MAMQLQLQERPLEAYPAMTRVREEPTTLARALEAPTPLARTLEDQGRRAGWVAQRIQVHRNTISRWVNGREAVPPARVGQLAALLGVDEGAIVARREVTA